MAGGLVPIPDLDAPAMLSKVLAAFDKVVTPSVPDAEEGVRALRKSKPLVEAKTLIGPLTKRDRINAARAVAFALPAIVPGLGMGLAAAAAPVALVDILKHSVTVSTKIGVLFGQDLSDPEIAQLGTLLTLTKVAIHLDKTGKVNPAALLGTYATLLAPDADFDAVRLLSKAERAKVLASQKELLQAWGLAVGPPLLVGLAPFGIGPMAAANYVDYVMKQTIKQAAQVYGKASTVRLVEELDQSEVIDEPPSHAP